MNKKAVSGLMIFLIIVPVLIAILAAGYYLLTEPILKIIILSLLIFLVLMTIISVLHHFFSAQNRLRRKLEQVPSITTGESLERMKQHYTEIYRLYAKLSEHQKQNFYAQVMEIRERIERKLKAEKKMELLAGNIGRGSLEDQKQNYLQMHEIYKRLPEAVRQKYYAHLAHARNLLEKKDA